MGKKLSIRILLLELACVVAALAAGMLLYSVGLPVYNEKQKDKKIMQAYHEICGLDLSNVVEEDLALFFKYEEEEGLSFCIATNKMKPVYVTNGRRNSIQRHITWYLDQFSSDPEIVRERGNVVNQAKLRGIVTQKGKDFYVSIREYSVGAKTVFSTGFFLALITLAFFGLWNVLAFRSVRRMLKPMDDVIRAAGQEAEGAPAGRLPEDGPYEELNGLAKSVNQMAERLSDQEAWIEEDKERLMRQNVQKERMEKLRKDSIANISHELKTPLAVILSQVEMLGYTQENREYYLSSIQEEAVKMSDLVSRLLDGSVMERQMENMVQKELDLKEIMGYIRMKYEGLAKKRKLSLDTFLEDGCRVCGDREYIEQAINNFMMNAIEHTKAGGNIRMTLKRQADKARVGVYNEGERIPEDEMEDIWNGYYRKPPKAEYGKNGFSHAGLGLYIVQSAVAMHGGECGVENLPDGVEFWFTLPALKIQGGG